MHIHEVARWQIAAVIATPCHSLYFPGAQNDRFNIAALPRRRGARSRIEDGLAAGQDLRPTMTDFGSQACDWLRRPARLWDSRQGKRCAQRRDDAPLGIPRRASRNYIGKVYERYRRATLGRDLLELEDGEKAD